MSAGFHKLRILNVKYVTVVAISEDGCLRRVRHIGGTVCVLLLPIKAGDQDTCATSPHCGSIASSYVVAVTHFSYLRLHLCGLMNNIFM
jgi:hypothetical protein